jgi:hypothetical protein
MPSRDDLKQAQREARGMLYGQGREMYEEGVPGMSRTFAGSRGMADPERDVEYRIDQMMNDEAMRLRNEDTLRRRAERQMTE